MSARKVGRYARLAGTLWREPRWSAVSLSAKGLWWGLTSYAADNATDGAVPAPVVLMCAGGSWPAAELGELAAIEVLVVTEANEVRLDWTGQLSRAEWEANKKGDRSRKAKSRAARRSDGTPELTDDDAPPDVDWGDP